jgi:S-adenosylmethionine hydrolase
VADTGRQLFVAPDNGVLSLVYAREEHVTVRHITATHYFLQPVSPTFHGRDIFAPVAGYLSKDIAAATLGEEVPDFVRFTLRSPKPAGDKTLQGVVLKVDHFGNLITNLRPQDVPQIFVMPPPPFRIAAGKGEVHAIKSTFGEGGPGEVFAIVGSVGFLEIVSNRGSAAQILAAGKGGEVTVTWQ